MQYVYEITYERAEMMMQAYAVCKLVDGIDDLEGENESRIAFIGRLDGSEDVMAVGNVQASLGIGDDIISPVFREGRADKGPIGYEVILLEDGVGGRYIDCVLWAGKRGGNAVVVPRCMGEGVMHFAARNGRLEARPGWPASQLAAGMRRAAERLRKINRAIRK